MVQTDEEFRVLSVFHCYTRIAATAHYQYELGLLDEEQLQNLTAVNALHLSTPIGKRYWESTKDLFSSSFIAYIEKEIEDSNLKAPEAFR